MADSYLLKADLRKEPANIVRRTGKIPAVVYGRGSENKLLEIDYQEFRRIFRDAGYSSILELSFDSKKVPVLVHEVDLDPVRDTFIHIDFIRTGSIRTES